MTPDYPCLHIARFTLEAQTAFALTSGLSDSVYDSLIVRDANNLPAIPGTSIAGVIRHRYQAQYGAAATEDVFGFAKSDDEAQPSRVCFSWGCVHDSGNKPVEGLRQDVDQDLLLERLIQDHPLHRHRVAIGHRGTAKDQMKFDTTLIPAGCRFTLEMSLWSQQKECAEWQQLLKLLHQPIRLGSATRNGSGIFAVESNSFHWNSFDFRNQSDWDQYCNLPRSLADTTGLKQIECIDNSSAGLNLTMALEAEDYWRFGQPGGPLIEGERSADDTMLAEPIIQWGKPKVFTVRKVVVPGSGVKGALAHRTVYHYNCLTGKFMDESVEDTRTVDCPVLREIFGYARDNDSEGPNGQAGVLFFTDIHLDINNNDNDIQTMVHNSIDRFSGGTLKGALYSEELVWQKSLTLAIYVDPNRAQRVEEKSRQALKMALDDLASGRLALGAAASRGHGYFHCKRMEWSDGGRWIRGEHNDQ